MTTLASILVDIDAVAADHPALAQVVGLATRCGAYAQHHLVDQATRRDHRSAVAVDVLDASIDYFDLKIICQMLSAVLLTCR